MFIVVCIYLYVYVYICIYWLIDLLFQGSSCPWTDTWVVGSQGIPYYLLYTIYYILSTIYYILYTIYYILYAIYYTTMLSTDIGLFVGKLFVWPSSAMTASTMAAFTYYPSCPESQSGNHLQEFFARMEGALLVNRPLNLRKTVQKTRTDHMPSSCWPSLALGDHFHTHTHTHTHTHSQTLERGTPGCTCFIWLVPTFP